jgi:uncharacterized protein (TIGR03067 family)
MGGRDNRQVARPTTDRFFQQGSSMKTKLLALVVLVGPLTGVGVGGGDEVKKELAKLQGTWKLGLQPGPNGGLEDPNETFIFDGDNLKTKRDTKISDEFQVKIIPGKTPKEIDLIPLREPNKGKPCPAIYKLDGNELTICVNFAPGAKRPTDFTATAKNRNILLIMEKIEKNQK